MIEVELPDGRIAEFPDGTSQEVMRNALMGLYGNQPEQPKSFLGGVSDAYNRRADMAQQAADAYQQGNQTLPETFLQVTGKGVAGLVNDVVGEGLAAGFRALPDVIEQPIREGASSAFNYIADSPVGDLAKSYLARYGEFAQENPRAARNIEAIGNIGGYVGAITPLGSQPVAGVTRQVAKTGADAAGKAVSTLKPTNLIRGFNARDVEALEQASQVIKSRASDAYNVMRQSGATFTPETTNTIANKVISSIEADGLLNPRLHDKAIGLMEDFKAYAASGDMTLEGLDQWRQLFGEVAGNFNDKINARKATQAIRAIDDAVENIGATDIVTGSREAVDALKLGRQEWARNRKFEAITDIVRKSDGDANYLKRELKKFLDNPKKTRGFSKEEIAALKTAATFSTGEGLLKMIGKFGFDLGGSRLGSGVGALVGSGVAGSATGGLGYVAAPVLGTAARQGQKLIGRGKVENLLNVIENN